MGVFEDLRDFGVSAFGTSAVVGGIGFGIYKGLQESRNPLTQTVSTVASAFSRKTPLVGSATSQFGRISTETFLRAQEAGFAVMGVEGWKTAVSKAVHASALGSGKVKVNEIKELVSEIESADPSDILRILQKREAKLGGITSVYENLRGLLGGKRIGSRGRDLNEIINNLGGSYSTSEFASSGNFWKQHLRFAEGITQSTGATRMALSQMNIPGGALSPMEYARNLENALKSMGLEATVVPGVRELQNLRSLEDISDPNPFGGRKFITGAGYEMERTVGGKKVKIPYSELQIKVGKTRAYIPIPYAREGFITSGAGKMSSAAVGKFTVPVAGGGRRLVDWNESLSMMLYGEGGQVGDNLATMLHKAHQEGKNMRDVALRFNQIVRSQVRDITTVAGGNIIATAHQVSYTPLEQVLARGVQTGGAYSTKELARIMEQAETSGIPAFPLASPTSVSESARFSLIPFHQRWDIFGEAFPYERRFMQRFRNFQPTQSAVAAMKSSPIYGKISRDIPLTATPEYVREVIGSGYRAPNVVMAYALENAQTLRAEEVLVSRKLSSMMETQTVKTYYLHSQFGSVAPGTRLEKGMLLGIDQQSGRAVYAPGTVKDVIEEVVGSETADGITKLTVSRKFGLQPQAKIFGIKATLRPAEQQALEKAAEMEWGATLGIRKGMPVAEAYGSVDLLKKNPAMIRSQMTEALLLLGAKRASVLQATGQEVPESLSKIFSRGGRRRFQKEITSQTRKFGVEERLLSLAKGWGFTSEELGWIAGHWHQTELKKIGEMSGDAAKAAQEELMSVFRNAGLSGIDQSEIAKAKFVIGAPTFYFGDYPSLNAWERGSIEPRGVKELLLQDWRTQKGTKIGQMLATEFERRRLPTQSLDEMERILYSMAGDAPKMGLPTYGAKEAIQRLEAGEGGFMMKLPKAGEAFGGTSIYVPSEARLMGSFVSEIGEDMPQPLLSNFLRTANAALLLEQGEEGAAQAFEVATKGLKDAAYKEWLMSTQARGQVAGTQAAVMQSWLGKHMHYRTVEDFMEAQGAFTIGIGKETLRESFLDLLSAAPEAEKPVIQSAMEKAMKTGEAYGFEYRHPMIYPYSTIPVKYKVTNQADYGVFHPTITIGNKRVDISGMLGMAADTDFDRAVVGVVTDEKMISALDETMNDTRFRKQYAKAMEMQYDLETLAKKQIGLVSSDYTKLEGLKRLAGIQVATPEISVAAQKMKAALHHATDPEQKLILSSLITQMEQRAISAKKGGAAEIISKAVANTVTAWTQGEGGLASTKDDFVKAWTSIWGSESFKAGDVEFDVHNMYKQLTGLMDQAKAGEHIEYGTNIVRKAASANRGAAINAGSMDEVVRNMRAYRAGIGDPAAHLVQSMRRGPGSIKDTISATGAAARSTMGSFKQALARNWKYPAIGIGAAIGARYLFGSSALDMPEPTHDQKATEQIANMPKEAPPVNMPYQPSQVIQTAGGSWGHPGMNMSATLSGHYNIEGTRNITSFASSLGSNVRGSLILRDERGAITPEFIRKQMDERYY